MHFFYRMDIKPIRKACAFTLLATFQKRTLRYILRHLPVLNATIG